MREQLLLQEEPELLLVDEKNEDGASSKSTLSVQLLITYYLLKTSGVDPRSNSDVSSVARLSHLLLGKDFKSLTNSEIYKKLLQMPHHKSDKELAKDLQFIRPYFEKLNAKSVLKLIDEDLTLVSVSSKKKK